MSNTDEILIERSLLSLILVSQSKTLFQHVVSRIDKTYFSVPIHQWIYEVILKNFTEFAEIPTKTVFRTHLTSLQEPSQTETRTILKNIYTLKINESDFEFLFDRLIKQRKLGEFLKTVESQLKDINVDNIHTQLDDFFIKVSSIASETTTESSSIRRFDLSENLLDQLTRFEKIDSHDQGILTPIHEMNLKYGGLRKQHFDIIAAPSGEGKSIFLLNFADYAHSLGFNILYFTIEMSYEDIESRRHSLITGVDSVKIRMKQLTDKEKRLFYRELCLRYLEQDQHQLFLDYFKKVDVPSLTEIDKVKLFYDDLSAKFKFRKNHFFIRDIPSNCTVERMKSEFKYLQKLYPIHLIVIDYLNIIEPAYRTGADWEQKNLIARNLKEWAREADLPILTGVQLKSESSKEKLTQEDLRFAKAIYDQADYAWGFNRSDEDKLCGRIQLQYMKNRHGPQEIINIKEQFSRMKISNFDDLDATPSAT